MHLVVRAAARVTIAVTVVAFALGEAHDARAANAQAAAAQVAAHNKAFMAAYEAGNTSKMKSESAKAVALGEKSGLRTNAVMADAYVLAAILEVDGKDNAAAGVRAFGKALKIKPDVAIPKGMATSGVKAALKKARVEAGLEPKDDGAKSAAAPASGAPAAASGAATATATEKTTTADKEQTATEEKQAQAKTQEAAARAEKEQKESAEAKAAEAKAETTSAADKAKDEAKAKDTKQTAALNARVAELEKDKADRDKQLADARSHAQQLERDKADRDKQLAALSARVAELEKDKADRDKQLADAKGHAQQLEKDEADRDKQLADARADEAREREAREKVEHEREVAAARERDAAAKKQQEQQERQRLFAGPPLPPRLPEPLHCEVPDEAPLRADLFVHCAARPNVKARSIVFYYRAGTARYTSVVMERTTKGWYAAIVPGVYVVGKSMQYYAEALDARDAVVASNGKETSPNILMLRPGAPRG
jgi:hypothetical protein